MADEPRDKNALLVAASIIAAVRLAREEINDSPRVRYQIGQSVALARMVLNKLNSGG